MIDGVSVCSPKNTSTTQDTLFHKLGYKISSPHPRGWSAPTSRVIRSLSGLSEAYWSKPGGRLVMDDRTEEFL